MILFPPAKINLGLQILRKRADGYHDIASCMYPIPLFDILEILPADSLEFRQSGLEIPDVPEHNLVLKAWRLLHEGHGAPPAFFHLRKQIPMGAGLGGGSADAAYVLRGMNELFALGLSDVALRNLAAELGSDCAFFVENRAQFAEGRGEILSSLPLDLQGYYLKLIHPGIHVSTAEAYAGVIPSEAQISIPEILKCPIETWKTQLHNDFEDSIFPLHPVLKTIKEGLYSEGAVYASMSGSGSAVFGIFTSKPERIAADGNCWVLAL
jgi:4-diphosphocytidyl-2-C-methyl-D-erythritol kinase